MTSPLRTRAAERARISLAAHPEIPLDHDDLTAAILARVPVEELAAIEGPLAHLEALHVDDLLLSEGCARGRDLALRAFERTYGADLDIAISKSPSLGLTKDEFRQVFREHVFVAPDEGRTPRIASYGARGPLRAWVRVAAARLVVDLSRKPDVPEPVPDDELTARLAGGGDAELDYLRHAYGEQVPSAFADALASLSARQRNLLRQRYLHALGSDRLATMYGVHRATMFAWLDEARAALVTGVRAAMQARLPGSELESVVAALGSRLDVSVRRLLESGLEPEKKPALPKKKG